MIVPIFPILLFLGVLLIFAWWMDTRGNARVLYHRDKGRRAASIVAAALVTTVVFRAMFPLSGISGGGLPIVAFLAFATGLAVAYFVRPAAKNDLWVWLIVAAIAVISSYAALDTALALPGSEGSRGARVLAVKHRCAQNVIINAKEGHVGIVSENG